VAARPPRYVRLSTLPLMRSPPSEATVMPCHSSAQSNGIGKVNSRGSWLSAAGVTILECSIAMGSRTASETVKALLNRYRNGRPCTSNMPGPIAGM
jgi:hypothetical protein